MWQLRGLQLVLNFLGNQFDIQPILKGTLDCAMVTIWGESSYRNSYLFDSDRVRYFGRMGISAQFIFPAAGNLMNRNRNVVLCNRQTSLVSNEDDIKVEMGKKLLVHTVVLGNKQLAWPELIALLSLDSDCLWQRWEDQGYEKLIMGDSKSWLGGTLGS